MNRQRIRPSLLALALCATILVTATACGSDDDSDGADSAGGAGSWSFVDGSGEEITLDEVPDRIVAHTNAAAALIPLGIRPVGIYADTAVETDLALSRLDLDGIEIVGEEWGNINIEAVAELEPDLIISEYWPLEKTYSGLEEGTGSSSEKLRDIAPIVGVAQGPSIETMIGDYEELAESLGADLTDPTVAADRARFETAKADFTAAIAAKPGLSVLAVSPTPESLYIAVPEHAAELSDFTAWGLDLVVPDTPDEGFEYWETLSWENADKYQADLLIVDQRTYPDNVEEAKTQPSWAFLKAAAADAVTAWPAYWLRNHKDYAEALTELTAAVQTVNPDLVP